MDNLNEGLLSKAEALKNNLNASDQLDAWFDQYVPAEGKAETLGGEIVRAICRVGHRWNNDGDRFGVGYGNETCNGAVCFLLKYVPGLVDTTFDLTTYSVKEIIEDVFSDYCVDTNTDIGKDDEGYEKWLNETYEIIVTYLRAHSDLFETPAEESYDEFHDKEWEAATYVPHFCPVCGEYIFDKGEMNADSDIWDSWWGNSGHEESEFDEDHQHQAEDIIQQYTDNYNSSCCSSCLSDAEGELDSLWEDFESQQGWDDDDDDNEDGDDNKELDEFEESTKKVQEQRIKINGDLDFSESDAHEFVAKNGYTNRNVAASGYWYVEDANGVVMLLIDLRQHKYLIQPSIKFESVGYNWEGQSFEEFKKDLKDAIKTIYPENKRTLNALQSYSDRYVADELGALANVLKQNYDYAITVDSKSQLSIETDVCNIKVGYMPGEWIYYVTIEKSGREDESKSFDDTTNLQEIARFIDNTINGFVDEEMAEQRNVLGIGPNQKLPEDDE